MQEARLIGMTTLTQDRFGWSVALEGDTAVIGSQQDDEAAGNGGAVFVFVRSGPPGSEMWIETAKLLASDAEDQDQFGFAVAISGSTILATNNISEIDTASAYVFERSGPPGSGIWNEQSKLSLPGIGAPGIFGNGNSVALEGNRALISFETDSELELAGGSVGVFVRSGPPGSEVWSLEGTLRPSNPAEGALFGWSLAIQGDEIVIGAPYNASTTTAGVAYLFNYTCITEFECPGDMDNNGVVDVDDLTFVILRLGTCL